MLGVVSSSQDRFLIKEVDVSLALQKKHKSSDLEAASDIVVSELYSLTYLLFKHGTQLCRRKIKLQENFLYKSILLQVIFFVNFILRGFSSTDPFNDIFLGLHVGLITPFGLVCQAIFFKDYGFDVFHRVYGEYKKNQLIPFWSLPSAFYALYNGICDAMIILAILIAPSYLTKNDGFFVMPGS